MPIEANTATVSAERATTSPGDAAQTLIELLERRAEEQRPGAGYTFLLDGENAEQHLGYGELRARARALAGALQGAEAGARALILLPPGLEFITAFFACLYAGLVAVPLPLPQGKRGLSRVLSVIADCRPALALTLAEVIEKSDGARQFPHMRWVAIDALPSRVDAAAFDVRAALAAVGAESPAFLQYTSGSTAAPKGVVLTHANLLHNERMIAEAFAHDERSVVVGWLPPHHDMGLIGNILQPLYLGVRCVQMAPHHFLLRPLRWLAAIARYRGTTSGGPNFAYDLCVRKISPAERAALDLSSWRVAFNGSEPVRAATLERFAEAFAGSGFERRAFYPCYGLAEATLFVTGGAAGRLPVVTHVEREALERGRVLGAEENAEGAPSLVGCGQTRAGAEVVIARPTTGERCADGEVGEIWIAGSTVAAGYWERREENAEQFGARLADGSGPFLRSGDLGFLQGGELFITGRLKDLIIVRGRNLYPQDLEVCAEGSHPSLREGGACAFSIEAEGEERVVLVHEVSEGAQRLDEAAAALRDAIARRHEVALHEVVFIKQGALPRTTSGKLQRRACKSLLGGGELPVVWRSGAEVERAVDAASVAPRGELESALGRLWCEVLARPEIGRHDQFWALGGDSLKAMQLCARVREVLGVELDPAALFDSATIASLALEMERRADAKIASASGNGALASESVAARDSAASPLSPVQERLWFLEQLAGGAPVYHIAVAAQLSGHLDVTALRRAIEDVTRRHPMLRARFSAARGAVEQHFDGPLAPELALRELPSGARAADIERVLREEAARPFESFASPPLRWTLLRIEEAQHVLAFVCHHLLIDGWAMNLVQRELWCAYGARAAGQAPSFAPLEVDYADYVHAQRDPSRAPRLEADLAYWRGQLERAGAPLELPTDRPRGAVQSYSGARMEVRLEEELLRALSELARREGVTLFATLATALFALVYRLTGQTDVCIGMPVAGRHRAGLPSVVGCCLETLPLRVSVSGDEPLARLASRVARAVRDALAHQEAPFERILSELALERDLSRPPLFQVMLSLQPELGALPTQPGLAVDLRQLDTGAAQFELALDVALDGGGARIAWEYATELFDPETVQGFAAQYTELLGALARRPALRSSEVELSSATSGAPGSVPAAPKSLRAQQAPLDVVDALQTVVGRSPDAVALRRADVSVSYAELWASSGRVALELARRGVGRESRVALYLASSPELVACVLGVLRAGAVYVPLDPHQPRASVEELVRDAGAVALVTDPATAEGLTGLAAPVWRSVELLEARAHGEAPLVDVAPEQLAYVLYTSGSTGRPKGVQVTRGALANASRAWRATHRAEPGEWRGLSIANPAFDVWTADWVRALGSGGRLVFAAPEVTLDPAALTALLEEERVSAVDLVPSLLGPLLELWERRGAAPASLRWCIVGSEAWTLGDYRRLRRLLPEVAQLASCYGVTEATVDSAWYEERRAADAAAVVSRPDAALVPLGRPFPGTALYVLDRDGRPVPSGAAGELYIGGAGLARGYLDNPRLTAERFVPHAGSSTPGARLYRTGDRVRLRRDGVLEFLGRVDHQVKVRGRRVEPGEVEQRLAAHPAVRQCVVVSDARGSLVAYLVANGAPAPAAELRAFLRERLAEALVPASFVWLDALPLNKNGKLDRKALPAPAPARAASVAASLPTSTLERQIAQIWCDVLGVDSVGTRDNFFDLGGHSLQLTRVLAALRDSVAPGVSMVTLFRHPTVHDLATALGASKDGPVADGAAERERTLDAAPRRAELRARRRRAQESGR